MPGFEGPMSVTFQVKGEGEQITDVTDRIIRVLDGLADVQMVLEADWGELIQLPVEKTVKVCVKARVDLLYEYTTTTVDAKALADNVENEYSCLDRFLEDQNLGRLEYREADTQSLVVTCIQEIDDNGDFVGDEALYNVYR